MQADDYILVENKPADNISVANNFSLDNFSYNGKGLYVFLTW
jgi:hypothetical protein